MVDSLNVALIYKDGLQAGGYPRDVRWLAGALSERCEQVWLVADGGRHEDGLGSAIVVDNADARRLRGSVSVAHAFGIFHPRQFATQGMLRPTVRVLSPLAQLMADHMSRKKWKKQPYVVLTRPWMAPAETVLHVFSEVEARETSKYWDRHRRFTGTLGIYPPPELSPVTERHVSDDFFLFLGRNDVNQKGLDLLLRGYAHARRKGVAIPLLIAGAASGDSTKTLRGLVASHALDGFVRILGPVSETEKWHLLRSARALVFLSRWDGPPRPVRESISVGTPVIVSHGTNLGALVSQWRAGFVVTLDAAALGVGDELAKAADDHEIAIRRLGVIALSQQLGWQTVVNDYLDGYVAALAVAKSAV